MDTKAYRSGIRIIMNRNVGASFTLSVLVVGFFTVVLYPHEGTPPPWSAMNAVAKTETPGLAPPVPPSPPTPGGPRIDAADVTGPEPASKPEEAARGGPGPTASIGAGSGHLGPIRAARTPGREPSLCPERFGHATEPGTRRGEGTDHLATADPLATSRASGVHARRRGRVAHGCRESGLRLTGGGRDALAGQSRLPRAPGFSPPRGNAPADALNPSRSTISEGGPSAARLADIPRKVPLCRAHKPLRK